MEDLKNNSLVFVTVEEFLTSLRQKFREKDNKIMKVAELKKVKQKNKTIKKFVQEFRKVAKKSEYKKKPLIKELK